MALATGEGGGGFGEGGEGGGSYRSRGHGIQEATGTAAPVPVSRDTSIVSAVGHAAGVVARPSTVTKATSGGNSEVTKGSSGRDESNLAGSGAGAVARASTVKKGTSGGTGAITINGRDKSNQGESGRIISNNSGNAINKGGGSRDEGEGGSRISIHFKGGGGRRARVGRLFEGFLIVLLGFKSPAKDKIQGTITEMGGSVLSPSDYERSTHICLMKEEGKTGGDVRPILHIAGKKIVTQDWIYKCCADNANYNEPDSGKSTVMVVSTGKKPRPVPRLSQGRAAIRHLSFDEEIDEEKVRRYHHQLSFCEQDQSSNIMSLADYGQKMKGKTRIEEACPGTDHIPTYHTSTVMEVKHLVKDIYMLLKTLKKAGYSLGGVFSAKNFLLAHGLYQKKVMFGQLEQGSLQWANANAEKNDVKSFKMMVRKEIFKGVLQPHDVTIWLSLVGCLELEELIPYHLYLQDNEDACSKFLVLCDTFKDDIEAHKLTHKRDIFDRIVKNLEAYNHWQKISQMLMGIST